VTIGGVLGEAWSLYKRFLGRFFVTALIVFAILDLFSALASTAAGDSWVSGALWGLLAVTIGVVGYFWVQAALVETVNDVRDGRADRSVAETYRAVQPVLPAVIVAGILAGIGIGIGFILLIIPGLFLLTIWSMLIPVIVIERRRAGEAFTRSRELVRGHGWQVFGLMIITFLLLGIVSGVIRALFAPLPDFLDAWLGSLVAHSLTIPFAAAALTSAYFKLVAPAEPEGASPAAPAAP
jgi:TRAP-type C4-dicarboxylate transport system permease large subunit